MMFARDGPENEDFAHHLRQRCYAGVAPRETKISANDQQGKWDLHKRDRAGIGICLGLGCEPI